MQPLGHLLEHYLRLRISKGLSEPQIVIQKRTALCSAKLLLVKFVVNGRTKVSISIQARYILLNRVV
jgi:hypothetical protein